MGHWVRGADKRDDVGILAIDADRVEAMAYGLASQLHGGTAGQKNVVWIDRRLVLGYLYELAGCEGSLTRAQCRDE